MKKARAEHFKVRGWPLVLFKYFSFTSIIILQVFLYNITVLQLPYCLNLIESSNCNVYIYKGYVSKKSINPWVIQRVLQSTKFLNVISVLLKSCFPNSKLFNFQDLIINFPPDATHFLVN